MGYVDLVDVDITHSMKLGLNLAGNESTAEMLVEHVAQMQLERVVTCLAERFIITGQADCLPGIINADEQTAALSIGERSRCLYTMTCSSFSLTVPSLMSQRRVAAPLLAADSRSLLLHQRHLL